MRADSLHLYDGRMVLAAKPLPSGDLLAELERRVKTQGSGPLITWYDLDEGFRTELSGRTFANWVDKTANLLVSMDVDDFPRVANTLLVTHPGSWVGLVWTMAVWQLGGQVVAIDRRKLHSTNLLDAAVVGPDEPHPVPGVETIACSLHPMGAGFGTRPLGVTDYSEALSQPDVHWRVPAEHPTCFQAERSIGWDELAATTPSSERIALVADHTKPWQTVQQALVAPVLGGGSVVILAGGDSEAITAVAAQERARLAGVSTGDE